MLESLDQSNIKRMSVEKPEQTRGLDIEEVLTPDKRSQIEEIILVGSGGVGPARLASNYKCLNPDFVLDTKTHLSFMHNYSVGQNVMNIDGYNFTRMSSLLDYRVALKAFDIPAGIEPQNSDINRFIEKFRLEHEHWTLVDTLTKLKLLYPDRNFEKPDDRENILSLQSVPTKARPLDMIEFLYDIQILYPDLKPQFNETEFDAMVASVKELAKHSTSREELSQLCEYAYRLSQIEPNLLDYHPPQTKPLPEQRNF